jgi:hypothetical protein
MGRTPEYKKDKTEEDLIAEVEKCVYKDILTPKQMAAYLSKYSRNQIHFDERKVKIRVSDICKLTGGLLETKDFVKDPSKPNSKYVFKPEWHGLLFALMDTEYFDNRKNDRLLGTRENQYRDFTVNVEFYLDEKDKEIIKSYPGYMLAACEGIASEAINYQMQTVIREAMHADEVIRLKLLSRIYDTLIELREKNARNISGIFANKMVYKHNFDDMEDGQYLSTLFDADSLPSFMAYYLALKVKGRGYDELANYNMLTYNQIFNAARIDEPVEITSKKDCDKFLAEMDKKIEETEQYKSLMDRIEGIMNLDDPLERILYRDFEYMTRTRIITETFNREEARKNKAFLEASMQMDMYDLLNEFLNGDFNTPVVTELQRIQSQEAFLKNKFNKN